MLWLACTAVVATAAYFTLKPLLSEREGNLDFDLLAETELDRLLDQKTVVYRNLRDLEFEHKMGRLSAEDYEQLAAGYKHEAALILQRLERLNASEDLDRAIEKDVEERKAGLYGPRQKQQATVCPSCGAEAIPGKRYCADCGHHL